MAQTANFTPVVIDQDNSIQYLGQTLQNVAKEKQARQQAVQQAILKQKSANDAIYGDTSKVIREYYDKAKSLSSYERDRIFSENIAMLSKIPKDSPEYLKAATQIVNNASTAFNGINQTFADTEAVIEGLTKEGRKINPEAVRNFALTSMYDYNTAGQDNRNIIEGLSSGVLEPVGGMSREQAIREAMFNGQVPVRKLKNVSQLQDFGANLRQEVLLHPELYADRGGVKQDATAATAKFLTTAKPAGDSLELDPTGTKTLKIGTEYTLSSFDKEETLKDKETGLEYKKPRLNTIKIPGLFYKGGNSVEGLADEPYMTLLNSGGQAVQDDIAISALENIRQHNAEVMNRAAIPNGEQLALTVSKNNVQNFMSIPGFVNPFDEGELEKFQRAAAADLLKQSGRYEADGSVAGFKLNRGVNKAKPVSEGSGGKGSEANSGFMDVYNEIVTAADTGNKVREVKGGKVTKIFGAAVNQLSPDAQGYLINIANKTKKKYDDEQNEVEFTQDDLVIKKESGKVGLYRYPSGELIAPLDKMQTNLKLNPTAKTKQNVINSKKTGSVIPKAEFAKMTISERQKFISEGGTFK
jgi:hypothetical protein